MTERWRAVLRIGLFLVAVFAVVGIAGVGVRAVLERGKRGAGQTAEPTEQPQAGKSLTQRLLGVYLALNQGEINQPVNPADTRKLSFSIAPGETAATIGPRLEKMGLIREASLFTALVRYRGVDAALQVGEYQLSPSMSMAQVVTELQHGRARTVKVTIPEGWRMEQIAEQLAAAGLGKAEDYLALMRKNDYPYPWLQSRPADAPAGLEGFLFPDTYEIPQDAAPAAVIDMMLRNFDRKVTPELRSALTSHGLSFYQAITLAAIVEREAVLAKERPVIASVFLGRLDKGMYLQADPTVSYAKGYDPATNAWWTPMTEEDPQGVDSPYNSFEYPGLTPGPICSPGLGSIRAAAYPAQTNYLYFVAKGDGSHAFSQSYDEHLKNVQKYQQ